jgi:Zn-dependent peptidase ImmA (M78 family)/transcriptional regulator with XRE-family HTH domain
MQNNILAFPESLARPTFNREALKEARLQKGWSQSELARRMGVSAEMISNLESGQRQPGADTLIQLCDKLEFPLAYFSSETNSGGKLEGVISFRSRASKTKRQNDCLNTWRKQAGRILKFINQYVNLPPVRLPHVVWSETDPGDDVVERTELLAQECRRTWGIGDGPIGNLTRLVESMGVCVVQLDLPDMDDVDGFSCWQDGRPMIFLVAKQSAGRGRFNVAHEVLHLIAHRQIPNDSLEDKHVLTQLEAHAHTFASALLLPRKTYGREIVSLNVNHFIQQKRRWNVSMAAQAKRCLQLGILDDDQFLQFRKNLSWNKYVKKEPLDDTVPREEPLMMKQAIEMLCKHGIVRGWQIGEQFNLPLANMEQITKMDAAVFASPKEPGQSLKFELRHP